MHLRPFASSRRIRLRDADFHRRAQRPESLQNRLDMGVVIQSQQPVDLFPIGKLHQPLKIGSAKAAPAKCHVEGGLQLEHDRQFDTVG